jgi:hypothetical protein
LESFIQWFELCVDEVFFVEKRLFDHLLEYNGKPDMFCRLKDGRLCVPDWKTAISEGPTWKAQVAAYVQLVKVYLREKGDPLLGDKRFRTMFGMSVRLDSNGNPAKATPYQATMRDFGAFSSALLAYRYFKL